MFNHAEMPAWYDWAYALSEKGLFALAIGGVLLVGLVASALILLYHRFFYRTTISTMAPQMIAAIVLPASVIIGLLVNDVWGKYTEAQQAVLQEAAVVADITRSVFRLPEEAQDPLQALLSAYVHEDLPHDWSTFKTRKLPLEMGAATTGMERKLLRLYGSYPADLGALQTLGHLQTRLAELNTLRSKRIYLSRGQLDNGRWLVLTLLLLACMAVMAEVVYHNRRNHAMVLLLFTLSYGALIYMLLTHDRPYSGQTVVSPTPIVESYTLQLFVMQSQ